MKRFKFSIFTSNQRARHLAVSILLSCPALSAAESSFNAEVRPLLSDRCFACHGPDSHDRKGNLRLDRADGEDGAYRTHKGSTAIKPGSIEDSELWYRITTDDPDEVMPPPKSHKKIFSKEEQAVIKSWIEAGAPYENFWAFVPPKKSPAPEVKDKVWGAAAIDAHVLAKIEAAGLKPSSEADKRLLIRRLSFDITGLPPTREDVRAFAGDTDPDAYEKLVDRLLAKPQYGEHMARYWLDLVRFADTNGMHKDFYRNLVAYRDWVIRSFNDNLGYDEFLRYQLAGDLFPDASNDQLVASGFNRLHLIIDRGTALPEESFFKNVLDRTTAVGTAFMGLTVNCATCHDHKYDPITQRDFYSLFAFFNNIDSQPETAGRPRDGLQPPFISLVSKDQEAQLKTLQETQAKMESALKAAKRAAEDEKNLAKKRELNAVAKKAEQEFNTAKKARENFDKSIPKAMVMKERAEVRPTFIMERGDYEKPGDPVTRNTPSFLPPLAREGEVATRMDLANWFVQPDNPLTARVAVNRFWQQFFGVGIVKTSGDIGAQGEPPSHPELLDHLATSFVDSGWDMKALIREIVLSKAYRQSSVATPEQFRSDPDNRLLARGSRFRMDAEMIRDQILATSGLLSDTMLGRSVKPPQPDGLWKAVTMTGERFKPDSGEDIYRRSVYTYWKRGMPPPQMTILNAPTRDACTARRERTNTPTQALLLLNESEYLKAAREFAGKIVAKQGVGKNPSHGIAYAYEIVTSQTPDEKEMEIFTDLHKKLHTYYAKTPELADKLCEGIETKSAEERAEIARWTVFINTLYNLDITKTRQ